MTVRILRWATGCVAAVSVALLVAGIALSYVYRHMGSLSRWDFSDVFEEATFIAVPVVGFILTSRRPGNRVGWIFLGVGLALGLGFFCDRYGRGGLVAAPGSLPAARAAAWYANWAWTTIPAAGLAFILLLFPDGRLISRRWRPVAWFAAAAFTLYAAAEVARACQVWADPFTALSSGWYPGSHTAVLIVVPAALLASAAAVVVRFAGSSGAERLQLKWFMAAGVLVVAAIIPLSLAPQIGLSPAAASAAVSTLKVVFCLALVCLVRRDRGRGLEVPAVRHRPGHLPDAGLRDRHRRARRGLRRAGAAGDPGVPRAHPGGRRRRHPGRGGPVRPVRRRVQRRVDRRFNRARYDADQTVAAFAARLKDAVDLDTVREELARVVQAALEPAHVSMWTSRRE